MENARLSFSHRGRLALLLTLALGLRALTLGLASDVDTGGVLVRAKCVAEGRLLYRDIGCSKPPLKILVGEAIYRLSPEHFFADSRLFMICASALVVIPIYLIGLRLFGTFAATGAALLYAMDPLSVFYARELHASVLEAVLGVWAMWVALAALQSQRRRAALCFATGCMAGAVFLAKQSGAALAPVFPLLALLLGRDLRWDPSPRRALRDLAPYAGGFLGIVGIVLLYYARQGVLRDLLRQTYFMHMELRGLAGQTSRVGTLGAKVFQMLVVGGMDGWLWLFGAFGAVCLAWRRDDRALLPFVWIAGLAIFLVGVYYEAYDHYFLAWLAPVCLLAGHGLERAWESWKRSLAEDRLSAGACRLLALVCVLLLGEEAGAFLQAGRQAAFASLACVAAAVIGLRLLLNRSAGTEDGARWKRPLVALLGVVIVAGALYPYWDRRGRYPYPWIPAALDREAATWVRSQLRPGDDVAVLTNPVEILEGGWRALPAYWFGRRIIEPRAAIDTMRPFTPDPKSLAATVALWQQEFHVRFIMMYQMHVGWLDAPGNEPMKKFFNSGFREVKRFDYGQSDGYGHIVVFER